MKKLIIISLFIIWPLTAGAATVTLESGKVIQGKIIEKTEDYITVDTGQQIWRIRYRMMSQEDAQYYRSYQIGDPPRPDPRSSPPTMVLPMGPRPTPTARPPAAQQPPSKNINQILDDKIKPHDHIYKTSGLTGEDFRSVIATIDTEAVAAELLRTAKAYYYMGDTANAISYGLKAIEDDPNSAQAMFTLGFIYWEKKDFTAALKYYQKAVFLDPDLAYGQIGDIYREKGQCPMAVTFYEDFLKNFPDEHAGSFGVYHSLGRCYIFLKRFGKAVTAFEQSIKYKPDYAQAYIDLGYAYRLVDKPKEAVEVFLKAIEMRPYNYHAYRGLGRSYSELNQPEPAVKALSQALELEPGIELISDIVRELAKLGRYEECLQYLEQAQKLAPANPEIYSAMARYQVFLGLSEEAVYNYTRAIDIYRRQGALDEVLRLKRTIEAVERLDKR